MISGLNITLPIWQESGQSVVSFHDLVLRKPVVDSVSMSLSDKITGDVYYKNSNLEFTMREFVTYNDVNYYLVNPPTTVREGQVKDNNELKGMTKYSFEFYHPMYILGNMPFSDVAVSYDELRYKSQDKTFSWIGKPADFVAKLNKNLEGTEWVVVLSERFPIDKVDVLSEVLSFDNATIGDALKTGYETWDVPYVIDKLYRGEYTHTDANHNNTDYYDEGKRFVVVFGLPSNEIYEQDGDSEPYVFEFGQGVGLKNNSRTPRNNKIITRIAGYGSEDNIPYGYPQIRWYGNQDWDYTINNQSGMQEITVNGQTFTAMSYPIYKGIVGGEWVKLIKHPFTRNHLMPTIYANSVFDKVSQFTLDGGGNVITNPNFDPNLEIKDYYDAVENSDGYDYQNLINVSAPSYEIHDFQDIKPELGEAHILDAIPINADLTDAENWDDTMDDDGNYLQSYFKITLPVLDFDIYACAAITQEMQINMRSGACIGCTFTVQVDWEDYKRNFYDADLNFLPHGSQRDLTRYPDSSQESITIVVQKDINTFGTLMPNIYQYPKGQIVENGEITYAGDAFVVLGISLPLSYIGNAQERLDDAMKSYMLENNVYYFDYPLKFDEFFLAKHQFILNQIRPNCIIRFLYNNRQLELFVKQLTIKYGESVLPQYDITLTDNIDVVLNSIGQVADEVQHLGSLVALLRQSFNKSVWVELAKKLSRVSDDTALGKIIFSNGLDVGQFLHGWLGNGANINSDGKGEFEEITVRGALRATELVFNLISAEAGESIRSIGNGEILEVTETSRTTGIATLKLEGDEYATIDVGDICRGMYNTIDKEGYVSNDEEDENGFRNKRGFFSSYFVITEIIKNTKGECEFKYSLQTENGIAVTEHPCALMKFAVYGNTDDSKSERQSSMYITAVGIAPRMLYLAHVNTWKIRPQNIKVALGYIDGLQVWEIVDGEPQIKILDGDAGLYVEDNVFLGGIINQFTSADWDAIQEHLGNGIHAQLTRGSDNIVVDALGNIVGGIYTIEGDTKRYKLRTGVTVYDSGKKEYLTAKPISDNTPIRDGEFRIIHTCDGCTVQRDGSDFYITSIDNTNDGISGTILTDEELDLMRETSQCVVNFTIETYNGWQTIMSYPVKITHLDYAYVTFDLSNEYDSMSYRTQTKRYVGLPITTDIKAFVNGVEANVTTISVKSDLFNGSIVTLNGGSQRKNLQCGLYVEVNGNTLTIDHNNSSVIDGDGNISTAEIDLEDAKHWFDINAVAKYAGIPYESGNMRFTIAETTDTTVYKLLISANAILKEGNSYTPSSIDVNVQVIDDNGMNVRTDAWMESNSNVKVRYMKGVYSMNKEMFSTCPAFSDPTVVDCITVLLVDTTDGTLLDIESVTINSKGLDGAGQSYIATNVEEVVIDCDSYGRVLETQHFDVVSSLYWGDHKININDWSYTYNGNTTGSQTVGEELYQVTVRYTFNQGDILSTSYIEIFIDGEVDGGGDEHHASKSIPVRPNKQGKDGKTGSPGASIVFVGEWTDSRGYTWNNYIRNAVKHNGYYWLVNVRCENAALDEPSTSSDWIRMSTMEFVATQLLLAENGTINLLSSNVINLFGANGIRAASINEDGKGAYRIYYPSGKKMMEFSPDGYIYYYNDNPSNSIEWKLGHGGSILNSQSDDWKPIYLHLLSTQDLNNFNGNTSFSRTEYYQFFNGTSMLFPDAEKQIFTGKPNNNNPYNPEPSTIAPISDGLYTPNSIPMHKIDDDSEQLNYSIVVYQIIGGKIDGQYVRVLIDGNYYDEPY